MDQSEGQQNIPNTKPDRSLPSGAGGDAVILNLGIRKEEYSISLYKALMDFVKREDSKELVRTLMEEEKGHFKLLKEAMITGRYHRVGVPSGETSLEITTYMVKEELKDAASPEQIVKLAIRREEEAEEFYLSRLEFIQDPALKTLYRKLAQEEVNHRNKLLRNYDDLIIMNFA